MGLIRQTLDSVRNVSSFAPIAIQHWQNGQPQITDGKYYGFAKEGYQANELVYAGIEELASSAAEPRLQVSRSGKWLDDHPMVELLNRPNPFMDRFAFWANVIMHVYIGGNAYGLIVKSGSGRPVELWLMRPDRIRIVPDSSKYIARYEYDSGDGKPTPLPVSDVIHWKKRNPLDDFYGQSPLLAGAGRIDIDNYMKSFVSSFFRRAGIPVGMLNIEGSVTPEERTEIRDRFARDYGGENGWHGLMVIAKNKASFTPMTRDLGNSGLVVPELDEIAEARILMLLGVPPELIGARVGMQNSSYAQKRSARESFWDETLAPLYKEMAGPLTLRLAPYYPRITDVRFDLSDVRALQEDIDKISARERADLLASALTREEYRERRGYGPTPEGTWLVPTTHVPSEDGMLPEPEPPPAPAIAEVPA
jgi:HK97 family phage portal protein